MPELPEVEVTRQSLENHIQGQYIKSIDIREKRLRWTVDQDALENLLGHKILTLGRRGKYILINTKAGTALLHLGMSGSVGILKDDQPLKKHDHFDLVLGNQHIVRFNDPRRFGSFLWAGQNPEEHRLIKTLGPEPLENNQLGSHLYSLSKSRTTSVKAFIMNAHVVVGVGNIYASEALFLSGIHPKRRANRVSKKRYIKLATAIQKILKESIKMGGTTLRDFSYSLDGQRVGYFKQELFVYGQKDRQCSYCKGLIKQTVLSGRSSFYCASCQN